MNKINDNITSSASYEKLMEFGLVYGDIKSHPIKKDKCNHLVFVNKKYRIEIKLESFKNNKFKLKTKQSNFKFVPRDKGYDDIYWQGNISIYLNVPRYFWVNIMEIIFLKLLKT